MSDRSSLRREDVTPEMLMAYADGELDTPTMVALAVLLGDHPDLQAEVDAYIDSRSVLNDALGDIADEPVPDRLRDLVLDGVAERPENVVPLSSRTPARKPAPSLSGWAQALAACFAIAGGIGIGVTLAGSGTPAPGGQAPSIILAGPVAPGSPLAKALETAPSATVITLAGGAVKPVQSFRTADGSLCREYEAGDGTTGVTGVACRSESGWRVEALVANFAAADLGDTGYRPASGLDTFALEGVLTDLGALPGLDASEESCLIAAGWRGEDCE